MANDLDYAQAVDAYQSSARRQTMAGLTTSPDDAARSVQLEDATGVPAQVINQNLPQFEENNQRQMATTIVSQNPALQAYVHSHPMAAGVSQDDWGNLDAFSRKASSTAQALQALNAPWQNAIEAGARGAVRGFKEGFGDLPSPGPASPTAVGSLLQSAGLLGQLANQGMSGIFGAITTGMGEAARAGAESIGVDKGTAASLGRDVSAMTEYHMITPGGEWMAAHEEPPRGIHPELDKAKAEINAKAADLISDDVKNAQASLTKERSPEMFAKLAEQHYGQQSIGISNDAVQALYGDKPATPDDGKLGWAVGINDKIEQAKLTGGDVEVPLADYVSNIDPAVHKDLEDHIRAWPGGVTAEEAKVPTEPLMAADPSPVQQVRAAVGTGPAYDTAAEPPEAQALRVQAAEAKARGETVSEPALQEALQNLQASGLGLDLKSFQRIQKLVADQHEADVNATLRQTEAAQVRKQTAEWKANSSEMEAEVRQSLLQRPDVAADMFVGAGELNGQKIRGRIPLRDDDLTAEQRAALPDHYVAKSGYPIDEVARAVGFASGDEMVSSLANYHLLKGDRSPKEFLEHQVKLGTQSAMEAKYGNLGENILSEAKDQALAQNSLNLLTEEYHAAALQAGVTAVDKTVVLEKAREMVGRMPMSEVDFNKQLNETGRQYRIAVRAMVAGDAQAAVVALERRTMAAHMAAELKKVQAEKGKFDAIAKRYSKQWDPTKEASVAPDFNLFTRDILGRLGLRNGLSGPGLAKAVSESGFTDLTDFVTKTEAENAVSGLAFPIPDWLMRAGQKGIELPRLSVDQFREVKDTVSMMDKVGRADQKIIKAGKAMDRKAWILDAVEQLKEKFPAIPSDEKRGTFRRAMSAVYATTLSNETRMSRWDGRDSHGIFTETISKPAAEAANNEAKIQRETAGAYRELGDIKDPTKKLASPFVDPRTGKALDFDRRNLAAVISNMGNNYNWSILAKGWKVDPDVLWKFVEDHSTPEDIERAQGLGKVFKGLKAQSDMVYQHLYGIAPEDVVPRPFVMHGKSYDGWYHPIIGDPELSRVINKMPELEVEKNFWPSTSNNYTKRRTGAIQVIDLTHDSIPLKMQQIIHDVAFRDFISNTSRIFKDDTFRNGVRTYYGKDHMQDMDLWLQRAAGVSSYNTSAMQLATKLSNNLRQNVITTQIAFNLGTVEKHGLTAGLMSLRELSPNLIKSLPGFAKITAEVAPSLFKRSVGDLFGKSAGMGDDIFKFIKDNSEEIQRRERNYIDTLGGAHTVTVGTGSALKDNYTHFKQTMTEKGASLVAFSDLLSAAPLWLAKYRSEFDLNGGIHGDAVREADYAVRRAHGTTAITNLPTIASGSGPVTPWLTSLYGFMGTSMQRRMEIMHDVNDAYKLGMHGEIGAAAKMVPAILSSTAVYVMWTGLVEEMITGQFTDDRRGFGQKALTFAFGTVAQSVIGLRDLVYDLETGRESAGLIATPIMDLKHLGRDLAKQQPLGKVHAGQLLQDACTAIGDLGGVCPKHLGTFGHYGVDVFNGFQHPRSGADIYRGVISGKQQMRIEK